MNLPFVNYYKFFYVFSGLLVLGAAACFLIFGLTFGIDFAGGSILEIEFEQRPAAKAIQEQLKDFNLGEIIVQPTDENGAIIRVGEIDSETHQEIIASLSQLSPLEERRFESIGPTIGRELRQKTVILIIASLIALLTYIIIVFKKIAGEIAGWHYGASSLLTLSFDILVTVGILSFLSNFYNIQFNIPIITALLVILGYTINDKVVVFDRIRENLLRSRGETFVNLVNKSVNQTLIRSISTSFSTLLVLFSLFLFGGETLKYFSFTLIIGIIIGTYSSLFLAGFLLATIQKKFRV